MIVDSLSLNNFRNYETATLSFEAGKTIFLGENGQGKTNLVEAIGYFSSLGSHRVSTDEPLVRAGMNDAQLHMVIRHGNRHLDLDLLITKKGGNRAHISGSPVRPSECARYFHSVIFAPEDLSLVRGDPSFRRKFVDQLLIQHRPRMTTVLSDYDRVLRQRTTLLKSARARHIPQGDLSTLAIWNEKLIDLGSQIIDARQEITKEILDPLRSAYGALVEEDHDVSVRWDLSFRDDNTDNFSDTATRFAHALDKRSKDELERGVTLVGPHRDDLVFLLRTLPVKGYASHGESWSYALALRLASAQLLREKSTVGDPVLVLDDVFAELDSARRDRLAESISGYEQIFITAAVGSDVPKMMNGKTFRVVHGTISEDSHNE